MISGDTLILNGLGCLEVQLEISQEFMALREYLLLQTILEADLMQLVGLTRMDLFGSLVEMAMILLGHQVIHFFLGKLICQKVHWVICGGTPTLNGHGCQEILQGMYVEFMEQKGSLLQTIIPELELTWSDGLILVELYGYSEDTGLIPLDLQVSSQASRTCFFDVTFFQ